MRGSVESLSFETISSDAKSSVRCKSGAVSRLSAVLFILVDRRRMVNGRCAKKICRINFFVRDDERRY
jgi:hypothetical protein